MGTYGTVFGGDISETVDRNEVVLHREETNWVTWPNQELPYGNA